MAPIKFEEDIRDKLEKRTLPPSAKAWGELSKRIENQEGKSSRKPFWWLGVAASIIGVLFVVSQFFANKTDGFETSEIVITPELIQESDSSKIVVKDIESINQLSKENKSKKEMESNVVIAKKIMPLEKEEVNKDAVAVTKKEIIQQEEKITIASVEVLPKPLTFEEQKIQDIVAQVKAFKENKTAITDADIEALLQHAQKEIALKLLINESTGIVDANMLLQDVETEIDQSFRSKVLKALKSSYNSVKTTVAQRND